MEFRVQAGSYVTWTAHSQGHKKQHTGRVLGTIPPNVYPDIPDKYAHLPWERSRIKLSRNERYLIIVDDGVEYRETLYAPLIATIHKGLNNTPL